MQTFLPIPSFVESARCLDDKRLGKQRVEALQILKALRGEYSKTGAWENHPATKMWRGYETALGQYKNAMVSEWVARGFQNTMAWETTLDTFDMPWWWGDEAFHQSHQSNLLRKDPAFYAQFGWKVPPTLPYVWPSKNTSI